MPVGVRVDRSLSKVVDTGKPRPRVLRLFGDVASTTPNPSTVYGRKVDLISHTCLLTVLYHCLGMWLKPVSVLKVKGDVVRTSRSTPMDVRVCSSRRLNTRWDSVDPARIQERDILHLPCLGSLNEPH